MATSRVALLLSLLSLVVATPARRGEPAKVEVGVFERAPCPMPVPAPLVEGESVRCGTVAVPEFHARPKGRSLKLAVAVFPSLREKPAPDPFVIAPAGPGMSALGGLTGVMASPLGDALRAERDVVLVEFRGLPYAQPALTCPELRAAAEQRLEQGLSGEKAHELRKKALVACRERLVGEGVNLSAFNSVETGADLAMVMTALGYERFNLYGTSAGTMLAQQMMRDHPERLRAVILDSTVPAGSRNPFAEWPAIGARALKRLFEACAGDPACAKAYPGLEKGFDGLVDRLNEKPVTVDAKDPWSGAPVKAVFSGDLLAEGLNMASAQTDRIGWLPGFMHRLEKGDHRELGGFVWSVLLPSQFSWGLGNSVMCSQLVDPADRRIVLAGLYPSYEKAVADAFSGARAWLSICETWRVDRLDARYRQAVRSEVPTLVFAGQLDSYTPPEWAHEVTRNLGRAHVYELPGYGHDPAFQGPCQASMAMQFLNDPSKAPDASCIGSMRLKFDVPGEK